MIDLLMYITSGELIIGAVMYAAIVLDWLIDKSELYWDIFTAIMLFLVFSSVHNLIGLGIYGLFFF